ncbi:MAG: GxxExxY protein [Patescibacteria group bacterium]|nr:GxxExxY protein [Patescibacteria group bacterium]
MYEDHLYKDLTYKIIGAAFKVHKILGSVHKEIVYQKALAEELSLLEIPFKREEAIPIFYNGKKVGIYQPDFIVDDKVIVEIKALEFLSPQAKTQLSYYLKGTKYKIGLLLNFGLPGLEVHRRIYDRQ